MKALVLSGASNEVSSATPGVVTCNLPEDAAECNITGTLYNSKHLNAFHRSAGARANEPEYDSIVCRGLRNRTASPITFTSMNPTERAPGIRVMLSIKLGSFRKFWLRLPSSVAVLSRTSRALRTFTRPLEGRVRRTGSWAKGC